MRSIFGNVLNRRKLLPLSLLVAIISSRTAVGQSTAFSYQGHLLAGTNRADGVFDLTFSIWNAATGGVQLGGPLTVPGVGVSNGVFTVILNFSPAIFSGPDRWLSIAVRPNDLGGFTPLEPRQLLTPTPYAITARTVAANGLASGNYSNALVLQNPGNQVSGTFQGDGARLTNVVSVDAVSPLSYGAVGDGITVDDLAFSNAWNAARAQGAVFDFSSPGRTFLISNFVFTLPQGTPPSGIGRTDGGRPLIRGYGSQISHVGSSWLFAFTNASPDWKGLQVRGSGAAPGCILIAGAPSNGRIEDCRFFDYTNGIAILAEGLTDWLIQNVLASDCDVGFRFSRFCDALTLKGRANFCRIGFDFGAFPKLSLTSGGPPWAGLFDLVANGCGDAVVYVGRGASITLFAESSTNSFICLGHSLQRHGIDGMSEALGPVRIQGSWGFGNAFGTNSPIEVFAEAGPVQGRVELYGSQYADVMIKCWNTNADLSRFDFGGSSIAVQMQGLIEFSTGERTKMPGYNYSSQQIYNLPHRFLHNNLWLYNASARLPVLESSTLDQYDAPNAFLAGFYPSGGFKNFTRGLYVARAATVVTNQNLEVYGTVNVHGNLGADHGVAAGSEGVKNNGVLWRTGAGSPEGVVVAPIGSLYTRTNGGPGTTLYVKESGSGNTGWAPK